MRAAFLIATLLACASTSAHAQAKPNDREGFWISVGGGGAFVVAHSCGFGCEDEGALAASGYFRLGGTLYRNFLLGFEASGWVGSEGFFNYPRWSGSIVGLWYPSAKGASYVKFGLGALVGTNWTTSQASIVAGSLSLGLGYEFRAGRNMSVVPYIDGLVSPSVAVDLGENYLPHTGHVSMKIVNIGLGLTWH